jgi:hypothetical protein
MFTEFMRQPFEWSRGSVAVVLGEGGGAAARAARQSLCSMRGHSLLMCYRPYRLCLRCPCGYESPGWQIGTRLGHERRPAVLTGTRRPHVDSEAVRRAAWTSARLR